MVKDKAYRKGAIASLPELILIIFALALGLLLYGIASKFTGTQVTGVYDGEVIDGEPAFIYEVLSGLVTQCWERNDRGNSPDNDVCYRIRLVATDLLNESEFNEYHDCEYLPNNYLNMDTKRYEGCGDKDNIYWEIVHNDTDLKITYSASRKRIELVEEGADFIDEGCLERCNQICEESMNQCELEMDTCTGDDCEDIHEDCIKTSEEMSSICKYICSG